MLLNEFSEYSNDIPRDVFEKAERNFVVHVPEYLKVVWPNFSKHILLLQVCNLSMNVCKKFGQSDYFVNVSQTYKVSFKSYQQRLV